MKVELNQETVPTFAENGNAIHETLKLLYGMDSAPPVHDAIDKLQALEHAIPAASKACQNI